MTLPRTLVLALVLMAGIAGALIARAVSNRDELNSGPAPNVSPSPSQAVSACGPERTKLSSAKLQLAVCLAMHAPSHNNRLQPALSASSTPDPHEFESPEIKRNRELLEGDSEAVIVRRMDGTIGIYTPDEWPSNGAGEIIGHKFSDGSFGWYSRSNTDGGARAMFRGSSIEIEADGRITVRGKQAPPWVLQMLGESVDEPDASEQHSP